jgi:hypothetical protein
LERTPLPPMPTTWSSLERAQKKDLKQTIKNVVTTT